MESIKSLEQEISLLIRSSGQRCLKQDEFGVLTSPLTLKELDTVAPQEDDGMVSLQGLEEGIEWPDMQPVRLRNGSR